MHPMGSVYGVQLARVLVVWSQLPLRAICLRKILNSQSVLDRLVLRHVPTNVILSAKLQNCTYLSIIAWKIKGF